VEIAARAGTHDNWKPGKSCRSYFSILRSGVREFAFSSISLAGSLLVAHPSLLDPNFRRAVILFPAMIRRRVHSD